MRRVLPALLAVVACGAGERPPPSTTVFGGERPVTLQVGRRYDHAVPTPLVLLLHGYAASAQLQGEYVGLTSIVDEKNFLYAAPEGLVDSDGRRYWNGTDACCDFDDTGVDDVAYIVGLVDAISDEYNVDEDRISIFGHSNGGFLAHRIACEHPDRFASIVSLAGLPFADPTRCTPSSPLSVLQIHGTDDRTIRYDGGVPAQSDSAHASAPASMSMWSQKLGCSGERMAVESFDLDTSIVGAETKVERFGDCPDGVEVELWTIEGGGHIPSVMTGDRPDTFNRRVWRFMAEHPRP